MIRSLHHLLLAASAEEYEALARFLQALGLTAGESWDRPRNRGAKFEAVQSGIEIGMGQGFPAAELLLEVDNADIIYEQAQRIGAQIVDEIADCDWGARMFTLQLPAVHPNAPERVGDPGGRGRMAVFSYKDQQRYKVIEGSANAAGMRFAVVVSRFNAFITERLLAGALDALRVAGARNQDVEIVRVPGSYELGGAARMLATSGSYDALVCLGCLLRGETYHYEAIANETTRGIGQVTLDTGVPIGFGLLTCETLEQAIDRAGLKAGNKGWEAATAAVEMAHLRKATAGRSR